MSSGTLSIRRRASVAPPLRAPLRAAASAAADAIMSPRAKSSRPSFAPVLPASIAETIRTSVPSQSFTDTFDALLDRQEADDPDPMVQPADRTVLRFLLKYRWCATRPTTAEIARRLDREERYIWASIVRLKRCQLLPWGDHL